MLLSGTHLLSLGFPLILLSAAFVPNDGTLSTQDPTTTSPPAHLSSERSPSMSYSQEVALWPEGSQVLVDGMKALAHEDWALTHPSYLLYSPRVNTSKAAILVFLGGRI